jgi:plasmid stabilization system protein ParE
MSYTVKWTDESKITLNENLQYLNKKWGLLTVNNFLDRVEEAVETIQQNPNLYSVYRKSDQVLRLCWCSSPTNCMSLSCH